MQSVVVSAIRRVARLVMLPTALGGIALWGGVPSSQATEQVTLTFVSYGGITQKGEEVAWLNPFMQLHPEVTIVYDTVDLSKLKAMVESGNVVWDVVNVTSDFGLTSDERYLEKIDCTVVPCDQLQPDRFATTGYRAAYATSGVAIGYNTEKMPAGKVPEGWKDFFDLAAFPGKRVIMMDQSSLVFEQALLGDGVDPASLYPLDLDRAVAKLNSMGDSLIIAPSYQGCAELLSTGEAVMGGCWTGRLTDAKYNVQAPVEIQWNQGIISSGHLVIPKGSKNVGWAMKLIAYITSAENNAKFSNYVDYGPINIGALDKVDPAKSSRLQSSYFDVSIFVDDLWYEQNRNEVNTRWAEWISGIR